MPQPSRDAEDPFESSSSPTEPRASVRPARASDDAGERFQGFTPIDGPPEPQVVYRTESWALRGGLGAAGVALVASIVGALDDPTTWKMMPFFVGLSGIVGFLAGGRWGYWMDAVHRPADEAVRRREAEKSAEDEAWHRRLRDAERRSSD